MFKLISGGKAEADQTKAQARIQMERVLRGDSAAFEQLLLSLRPRIRFLLSDRYDWLKHAHRDLADEAETLLFEWWRRRDEGLLRADEAPGLLAMRLVSQVARTETRHREREKRLSDKIDADIEAEGHEPQMAEPDSPELGELMDDVERLPEQHREVIWAEVRFQQGDPTPPHEVLGLLPAAYRQRLHRARAALALRIERREKEHGDV
jgi:DNA-directed RNA polymerase specialized sigma24 family protein